MSMVGKMAARLDARLNSRLDLIDPRAAVGSETCGSGSLEQGHNPNPVDLAGFSTGLGDCDFMQQMQRQQVSASPQGAEEDLALQHGCEAAAPGAVVPVS
jgi:hypothetical protein